MADEEVVMGICEWWLFPRQERRVADMLQGMEEAAQWLETQAAYSGSNRSRFMAEAAKDVRVRMDMVRRGEP